MSAGTICWRYRSRRRAGILGVAGFGSHAGAFSAFFFPSSFSFSFSFPFSFPFSTILVYSLPALLAPPPLPSVGEEAVPGSDRPVTPGAHDHHIGDVQRRFPLADPPVRGLPSRTGVALDDIDLLDHHSASQLGRAHVG